MSACGGGTNEAPATQARPSGPTAIQLFGDSTMQLVAPLAAARYPGRVRNNARDGSSTTELIAGTDTVNAPWPQSVSRNYVLMNHGLNDGWAGRHVLTMAGYRANLEILAVAPGAEVIFQTPLPSIAAGRDRGGYAQVMREVAAEHGLKLIDVLPASRPHRNGRRCSRTARTRRRPGCR